MIIMIKRKRNNCVKEFFKLEHILCLGKKLFFKLREKQKQLLKIRVQKSIKFNLKYKNRNFF